MNLNSLIRFDLKSSQISQLMVTFIKMSGSKWISHRFSLRSNESLSCTEHQIWTTNWNLSKSQSMLYRTISRSDDRSISDYLTASFHLSVGHLCWCLVLFSKRGTLPSLSVCQWGVCQIQMALIEMEVVCNCVVLILCPVFTKDRITSA